jgi:hypothetical protein
LMTLANVSGGWTRNRCQKCYWRFHNHAAASALSVQCSSLSLRWDIIIMLQLQLCPSSVLHYLEGET